MSFVGNQQPTQGTAMEDTVEQAKAALEAAYYRFVGGSTDVRRSPGRELLQALKAGGLSVVGTSELESLRDELQNCQETLMHTSDAKTMLQGELRRQVAKAESTATAGAERKRSSLNPRKFAEGVARLVDGGNQQTTYTEGGK